MWILSALITIRLFESARIEFDAYRMDLELASGPANEEAQRSFAKHKVSRGRMLCAAKVLQISDLLQETYEKLRADVTVKMQFLDENRVS